MVQKLSLRCRHLLLGYFEGRLFLSNLVKRVAFSGFISGLHLISTVFTGRFLAHLFFSYGLYESTLRYESFSHVFVFLYLVLQVQGTLFFSLLVALDLKSFVLFDKFVVFCIFERNSLHLLVDVDVKNVDHFFFSGQNLRMCMKRLKLICTKVVCLDRFSLFYFFKLGYDHMKTLLEGKFLVVKVLASTGILAS